MKKQHLFIILFLSSLVLFSCKKDEEKDNITTAPSDADGWVQTGHKMAFRMYSDFIFADSMYYEVLEKQSSGAYKLKISYDDDAFEPTSYSYIKLINGDYYSSDNADFTNYVLSLKSKNLKVGDKWTVKATSTAGGTATSNFECVSLNNSITVPAGTFNAIKLNFDASSTTVGSYPITGYFYYTHKDGIIKSVQESEILGEIYTTLDMRLASKNF